MTKRPQNIASLLVISLTAVILSFSVKAAAVDAEVLEVLAARGHGGLVAVVRDRGAAVELQPPQRRRQRAQVGVGQIVAELHGE